MVKQRVIIISLFLIAVLVSRASISAQDPLGETATDVPLPSTMQSPQPVPSPAPVLEPQASPAPQSTVTKSLVGPPSPPPQTQAKESPEDNSKPQEVAPVVSPSPEEEREAKAMVAELSPQVETLNSAQLKKLAHAYSVSNSHVLSAKTYSIALSKNKNDVEALTLLAHEQILMNQDREALATLKEAQERNPKYDPLYMEMVLLYRKKQNWYELRMLYADMIQRLGPKPDYLQTLCKLYTQGGFFEEGKTTCRQGIVADRKDPRNYVNLAVCFRDTGHKDEAKSLMERSALNFPKSEDAQMMLGKYLEIEEKDFVKALKYYRAAIAANPKSVDAWLALAGCQLELQKYAEAYESYQKACGISQKALKELRRAKGLLSLAKVTTWFAKFDVLSETCALGLRK